MSKVVPKMPLIFERSKNEERLKKCIFVIFERSKKRGKIKEMYFRDLRKNEEKLMKMVRWRLRNVLSILTIFYDFLAVKCFQIPISLSKFITIFSVLFSKSTLHGV